MYVSQNISQTDITNSVYDFDIFNSKVVFDLNKLSYNYSKIVNYVGRLDLILSMNNIPENLYGYNYINNIILDNDSITIGKYLKLSDNTDLTYFLVGE